MLKRSARDFLQKELPKKLVRELDGSDMGYSPEVWKKMADLGWTGLPFPGKYGGGDGTFLDLVVLLDATGYNVTPGPFFSTVVLGGLMVLAAGSEAQKKDILPKVAAGDVKLSLALTEAGAKYDAKSVQTTATPRDGE